MKKNLGCLNATGFIAILIVVVTAGGAYMMGGGNLFSPGGLNDTQGALLGGVTSHAGLAGNCAACHTSPFSTETMDQRCLACHQDVATQMSTSTGLHAVLQKSQPASSCRTCHTEHHGATASLTLASVSASEHLLFGYSLQAHQTMQNGSAFTCQECHTNGYSGFDQAVCTTCHTQIDATVMQAHTTAYGTTCLACHDGIDTYGKAFDHNTTSFKLTGKHVSQTCYACHQGNLKLADMKATSTQCAGCHLKNDAHNGSMGTDCGACHNTEDWTQATFDHSKSTFPLTGAHITVPCTSCHINNVFAGTPTDCYSCHQKDDTHAGSFGQDCGSCHSTVSWAGATFDHSKTGFALTGAHINVPCTSCHVNNVFKGTSTQCSSCHADPTYHLGLFGLECASCHTTTAWTPATFNGPHTFPMDHGRASGCKSCHPSTLASYDCYTCHNQAQTISRHQEEGISDLSNCVRCHPNGRGGGGN